MIDQLSQMSNPNYTDENAGGGSFTFLSTDLTPSNI